MDLSQTIAPKSDQLNADDLIGGPRTITITRVTAAPDSPEQPVAIYFDGDNGKPYKPCKSMRRVMVAIWGADATQYAGRSLTMYRDPKVQFGGMQVGGVRISHMTHMESDTTMALTITKAKRAPYTVKRLVMKEAPPAPVAMTPDEAVTLARNAAGLGKEHFLSWYNSVQGKEARATNALAPIMPELQATVANADAAKAEDPFGLPPVATQTDAEIETKLREEIAVRDAMATAAE